MLADSTSHMSFVIDQHYQLLLLQHKLQAAAALILAVFVLCMEHVLTSSLRPMGSIIIKRLLKTCWDHHPYLWRQPAGGVIVCA